MSVFTIEVEGCPVVAFAKADRTTAERFAEEPELRESLTTLTRHGRPLWDGETRLRVREAHPEEASGWEESFARARRMGAAQESDRDAYVVLLLDATDPTGSWTGG